MFKCVSKFEDKPTALCGWCFRLRYHLQIDPKTDYSNRRVSKSRHENSIFKFEDPISAEFKFEKNTELNKHAIGWEKFKRVFFI